MSQQKTAQDFVDALNYKTMPQFGYELKQAGDCAFWVWPSRFRPLEVYPANERTRMALAGNENEAKKAYKELKEGATA
jgi:hypothetical protein